MSYRVPRSDIHFLLEHIIDTPALFGLPGNEELSLDLFHAVLDEAARFIEQEVVPLNQAADLTPPQLQNGVVTTTPGFKNAFSNFGQAGWQGLQHDAAIGGQDLSKLMGAIFGENMSAASAAFALCPLLTDSVIETFTEAATQEQKDTYLPAMLEGRWTGTMNLTESQAGSDLSMVKSVATPQNDGSYRVQGEKIFISYGDHDLAENIIHLVLARTPDAPAGIRGLSLFIVPKFLAHDQGEYKKGARNDVYCASLEHKLGLHGSPTAVMLYGDNKGEVGQGAIGYLIGELHRGLEYMFITMNAARYAIALQGLAVADRALFSAQSYAAERKQGGDLERKLPAPVSIEYHPDVERMLQTMRALTEGTRAVAYHAAWLKDMALKTEDETQRQDYQTQYEFYVPIVKGFATEMVNEVTSLGVQVHGGMGFIEETGVAQYMRDCRVFSIYEGTTAIQANDLIGRKVVRDEGAVALSLVQHIRDTLPLLQQQPNHKALAFIGLRLEQACQAYEQAVASLVTLHKDQNPQAVYLGSVPFLMLSGVLLGGWKMAQSALVCAESADPFAVQKMSTAVFYAAQILPRASMYSSAISDGEVLSLYPMPK